MKNLKFKLTFIEALSYMCGVLWRLILACVSLGFAGHLLYNYQAKYLIEHTDLSELNIKADYELSWSKYMKYMWLPVLGYIVISGASGLLTALFAPIVGASSVLIYVAGIIVGVTYMTQQHYIGLITSLKLEVISQEVVTPEYVTETEKIEVSI